MREGPILLNGAAALPCPASLAFPIQPELFA